MTFAITGFDHYFSFVICIFNIIHAKKKQQKKKQPPQKAPSQPQTSQQDDNDLPSQIPRLRHRQQETDHHEVPYALVLTLVRCKVGPITAYPDDTSTRAVP